MATYLPGVTDSFPAPALYTPDFSFMDNMLRRRTAMYEQGFDQLSKQYQFINGRLTNTKNQEFRDAYMKQAFNSLKNLSAVDLSQTQNVKTAMGVFRPFYDNENVLADMAYSRHMAQQESIAESERLSGTQNDASLTLLRRQMNEFAKSDPSASKTFYANRRSYDKFYDWNKEWAEAMKEFKPSSSKITYQNGYYLRDETDKSYYPAEIRRYMDARLSAQAKKQMRLEAEAAYADNPDFLTNTYISAGKDEIRDYKHNIGLIDKELLTEKDPERISLLKEQKETYEKGITENQDRISKLERGDNQFIKDNAVGIAYSIYYNQQLDKKSKGYAHKDIESTLRDDQVKLAFMKEDRQDARQARELSMRWQIALLKAADDDESGNGSGSGSGKGGGQGAVVTYNNKGDLESYENSVKNSQSKIEALDDQLHQLSYNQRVHVMTKLNETLPQSQQITDPNKITSDVISKWLKTGGPGGTKVPPTDHFYQTLNQIQELTNERSVHYNDIQQIENQAKVRLSAEDKQVITNTEAAIRNMKPIKVVGDDGKPHTISPMDIYHAVKNGTVTVDGDLWGWKSPDKIKINKISYDVADRLEGREARSVRKNVELLNAYNYIKSQLNSDAYSNLNDSKKEYFNNNVKLNPNIRAVVYQADSKNAKSLQNSFAAMLPNADNYNIQSAGVGSGGRNLGYSYFYVNPKKGDPKFDSNKIAELLTARGLTTKVIKVDESGTEMLQVSNLQNNIADRFRRFSPQEVTVLNGLETAPNNYRVIFTTSSGPQKFGIQKQNKRYYLYMMREGSDAWGQSANDVFDDPGKAILSANATAKAIQAGIIDLSGEEGMY